MGGVEKMTSRDAFGRFDRRIASGIGAGAKVATCANCGKLKVIHSMRLADYKRAHAGDDGPFFCDAGCVSKYRLKDGEPKTRGK